MDRNGYIKGEVYLSPANIPRVYLGEVDEKSPLHPSLKKCKIILWEELTDEEYLKYKKREPTPRPLP